MLLLNFTGHYNLKTMPDKTNKDYYSFYIKQIIDLLFAFLGLLFFSPLLLLIGILIKLDSKGPIIFKQKRMGGDGKVFVIYKFRTMVKGAEKLKEKYRHLNEVDGPVFKIRNDPRFTKVGKFLSHTGLDELPQLINIIKGDMSLVGPRPLPINEERKIPKKWQNTRRKARPGIFSSWLVNGAHELSFKEWMEIDTIDIEKSSFHHDLMILLKTVHLELKLLNSSLKIFYTVNNIVYFSLCHFRK